MAEKKETNPGFDVNEIGSDGHTPLTRAIVNGEDVKALIKAGADVNQPDASEFTPLSHAILANSLEVTNTLIEAGADVDECCFLGSLLSLAAGKGNATLMEALIEAGADLDESTNTWDSPLIRAVKKDSINCVNILIEEGADVDMCSAVEGNETPLTVASFHGYVTVVKALIEAGADVNKCDAYGRSPLSEAVHINNLVCVNMLIEAEADVNKCCSYGDTPLSYAVHKGFISVVKALIQAGADVNKCERQGLPPLFGAVDRNDINCLNMLIEAGADVNITFSAKTALYNACDKSVTIKMVSCLLKLGANVNDHTNSNLLQAIWQNTVHTPECKSCQKLKMVVAAGVVVPKCDVDGAEEKHPEIFEFMRGDSLKHLCREAIRAELRRLRNHGNMFVWVPKLPLPWMLKNYMLFNMSLNDEM